MIRILLIFALLRASVPSLAQSKRIDSLRTVLRYHTQADTFRFNRLIDLTNELTGLIDESRIPIARGDSVATLAMALAKQLNYSYAQARALYNMAHLKLAAQQRSTAQQLLAQALVLAEPSGDKVLLTGILRFTGHSYLGDGERALPYYQRALAMAKATGQPALVAVSMADLGTYYAYRFMYSSALYWDFQALREAEKAHSAKIEIPILHGIAGTYLDLTDYSQALTYLQKGLKKVGPGTEASEIIMLGDVGNCYLLTGRYAQAIVALQRGLSVSKAYQERPDFYGLPLEAILADTYERQGNPRTLPLARKVLIEAQSLHDRFVISRVSATLGRYHLRAGSADSAIYYGQQAIQYSLQDQNKIRFRDANQILAGAYAKRHEFANAYAYLSRYLAYKDSLNNDEVTRKATAAQFDDQMSRQQSQIALLTKNEQLQSEAARRQRLVLYGTLTVLVLIGGLVAVLYYSNRQQQKANKLLQVQKLQIQAQRDQTTQALTDLKATQTQLIQSAKMASLGELTAGIAHELQNPLNFVNNFSDLSTELVVELTDEYHKPERDSDLESDLLTDLTKNLQKVNYHGQRASGIVKNMLEHARTSTGKVQSTDINVLAQDFMRLAYHGFGTKADGFVCELVTDLDPALVPVEVVAQDIGRVLLNLFNNAFYAVQERQKVAPSDYKPTVKIQTRLSKGIVEIRVTDNGTGIAEGVLPKIFQPFFTTKPTGQGTGLGLSLSYDIITKGHGGNLTVESQPGEGTEFIASIPARMV